LPANKPSIGTANPVFNQYKDKGIVFNNSPIPLDYSESPGFAHSGAKAIVQCYGKEFCTTPFKMTFTSPQRHIRVWVGYSTSLSESRSVILLQIWQKISKAADR
jgi:hypothetical protein